jgi:hypothetical protein
MGHTRNSPIGSRLVVKRLAMLWSMISYRGGLIIRLRVRGGCKTSEQDADTRMTPPGQLGRVIKYKGPIRHSSRSPCILQGVVSKYQAARATFYVMWCYFDTTRFCVVPSFPLLQPSNQHPISSSPPPPHPAKLQSQTGPYPSH